MCACFWLWRVFTDCDNPLTLLCKTRSYPPDFGKEQLFHLILTLFILIYLLAIYFVLIKEEFVEKAPGPLMEMHKEKVYRYHSPPEYQVG